MKVHVKNIWFPLKETETYTVDGMLVVIPNTHIAEAIVYYLEKGLPFDMPDGFCWKGWSVTLEIKPDERTGSRFKFTQ